MKKHLVYYSVIISLLFISCAKDEEMVSKNYPLIQTNNVSNINSNGVRFNGEFLNLGYSEILEYGFVFSVTEPILEFSDTIIIPSQAIDGKFSKTIERSLAGHIRYNVKSYAKTSDYFIYGNNIEFESSGSKYNPWDLITKASLFGYFDVHGISSNELGFILHQSGDFYSFNPKSNSTTELKNFPVHGGSGTIFASFCLGNKLYVLTNGTKLIHVYDIVNDQWTKLGTSPFSTNDQNFGFSINNIGYFLSRGNFYSYNETTGTWLKLQNIPFTYIYSAKAANDKIYVLANSQDIWEYNPETDIWQKVSKFPGEWHGKIVSFSQNNKIYWGLSYYGNYNGAPSPATDFWEYNPEMNSWKEIENFPLYHSQVGVFTFSIDSLSYFGYETSVVQSSYMIFKFDSQRIK